MFGCSTKLNSCSFSLLYCPMKIREFRNSINIFSSDELGYLKLFTFHKKFCLEKKSLGRKLQWNNLGGELIHLRGKDQIPVHSLRKASNNVNEKKNRFTTKSSNWSYLFLNIKLLIHGTNGRQWVTHIVNTIKFYINESDARQQFFFYIDWIWVGIYWWCHKTLFLFLYCEHWKSVVINARAPMYININGWYDNTSYFLS